MICQERQQIIAGVLQSPQLLLLLQQQIHKALLSEHSQKNYQHCLQSQQLVLDLEDTLTSVVDLSVRRTINEQFDNLLDEHSRFRREFEQLKQKVLRLSIKVSHEELPDFRSRSRLQCWSSVRMCNTENSFEEELDQDFEMREQKEILTIKKLQHEIESVKEMLAKVSNNGLLQVVEENNSQIHRKIEDNFLKLSSVIQKNLERNSEIELEKSIHSFVDTHYQGIDAKMDSLVAAQKQLLERQRSFEESIICKHQVSLKSVWNVIAKIQSDIDYELDRGINSPSPKKQEAYTKTSKKNDERLQTSSSKKSIRSLLSWK